MKVVIRLLTLLAAGSQIAYAAETEQPASSFKTLLTTVKSSSWVATLSGGQAWESAGRTQTFFLAPDIEKTYTTNHTTHTLGEAELFLGMQQSLTGRWLGQLGFLYTYTSDAPLKGQIWDDADPLFNNYHYGYNVSHTGYALQGKLLAETGAILIPWLSASMGAGINHAHAFSNIPTIPEAVPSSNFSSQSTTAFTYTLGAGVQFKVAPHCQLGVGYEFADWGRSKLGRALGQTMNSGLSQSHLYTNSVLLNFTFVS